jgi:shikimate dehydrogenase
MAAGITLCGSLSQWAVPLGAAMHNAAYRALGLDWHYVPFAIDDLPGALAAMRTLGIRGFGVSVPFKLEILPLLDELEPLASRIGAVNTVVNEHGRLYGHNTDWVGAVRAVEEVTSLEGARVLLLGAGGAARAVAHGFARAGAEVVVCNRSNGRAAELARQMGGTPLPWAEREQPAGWDVVVNATSLGMGQVDGASPLSAAALSSTAVVMDIVYKPLATLLLQHARQHGARTIDGSRMLLHQAARQFELYTGRDAPLEAMDAALRRQIAAGATG